MARPSSMLVTKDGSWKVSDGDLNIEKNRAKILIELLQNEKKRK